MKLLMLSFTWLVSTLATYSQPTAPLKTDSVCRLVMKYFNQRNPDQIYALAGESFKKSLSPESFKAVCTQNLFPLGDIKNCIFEKQAGNMSRYKAEFGSLNLTMLLGLDKNDKIETFLFQPYTDPGATKKYRVSSSNSMQSPLDKEVDSVVRPYIQMLPTAGLSVGILKNGKTYYYGYGETAKGGGKLPDEHTIYEIGSISKTFTATLLAEAVQNKKVKLDDPVNKYLPDSIPPIQFEGIPVTLRDMANHSSGIPRMPSNFNPANALDPYKDYGNSQLFSFYKHFRTTRKPGTQYEYSNLAVGTLGVILEHVFHEPYDQLIRERICNPLGMNDTRQFLRPGDSARFAKGYNENGNYNPPWNFEALAGAGAIRSTAMDLLIYAKANMGDAPPALDSALQFTHPVTFTDGNSRVGLAWHHISPGKDDLLFHNGGTGGYRSYLAIDPEKKIAVVLLSNSSIGPEEAGNNLMKWLGSN
jgi:CubicO group peptidase (beta-lactamase class C family)